METKKLLTTKSRLKMNIRYLTHREPRDNFIVLTIVYLKLNKIFLAKIQNYITTLYFPHFTNVKKRRTNRLTTLQRFTTFRQLSRGCVQAHAQLQYSQPRLRNFKGYQPQISFIYFIYFFYYHCINFYIRIY